MGAECCSIKKENYLLEKDKKNEKENVRSK